MGFELIQEAFFGTEVDLFDDTGFTVDASGADPVGVQTASAFLKTRLDITGNTYHINRFMSST